MTILRDGETVHSCALTELTGQQMIQHMVGRAVNAIYQRDAIPPGDVLLKATGLSRGMLKDISFEIRAGEIVGLGGLMGAGRTELCRADLRFGQA